MRSIVRSSRIFPVVPCDRTISAPGRRFPGVFLSHAPLRPKQAFPYAEETDRSPRSGDSTLLVLLPSSKTESSLNTRRRSGGGVTGDGKGRGGGKKTLSRVAPHVFCAIKHNRHSPGCPVRFILSFYAWLCVSFLLCRALYLSSSASL